MTTQTQVHKFKTAHRINAEWCDKTDAGTSLRIALGRAVDAIADAWTVSDADEPFAMEISVSGLVPGDRFGSTLVVQNVREAMNAVGKELAGPVMTTVRKPKAAE